MSEQFEKYFINNEYPLIRNLAIKMRDYAIACNELNDMRSKKEELIKAKEIYLFRKTMTIAQIDEKYEKMKLEQNLHISLLNNQIRYIKSLKKQIKKNQISINFIAKKINIDLTINNNQNNKRTLIELENINDSNILKKSKIEINNKNKNSILLNEIFEESIQFKVEDLSVEDSDVEVDFELEDEVEDEDNEKIEVTDLVSDSE